MLIPPQAKRTYITKKCQVKDRCEDSSPAFAYQYLKHTCQDIKAALINDPNICNEHEHIQMYCPGTCGVCKNYVEKPIEVVGIFFHAHLLGREMYATIKKGNDGRIIDVESQSNWNYDNQNVYHIPKEKNVTIESGDEIQVSCVFDSSERDSNTKLHLSTYDEMCIHSFQTIHKTNDINYAPFGIFRCDGNITMGSLGESEKGLAIGTGLHHEVFKTDIWRSPFGNSADMKFDVSNEKILMNWYADENSCTSSNGIANYNAEKVIGVSALYIDQVGEKTDAAIQINAAYPNTYLSSWPSVQYQIREWDCIGTSLTLRFKNCADSSFQRCEPTFDATAYAPNWANKNECQSFTGLGNFQIIFGKANDLCADTAPEPAPPTNGIVKFQLSEAKCPDEADFESREQASVINTIYDYAGDTADGRAYYEGGRMYVYYDKACQPYMDPAWLISPEKPSLEVTSSLQYGPGGGRGPGTEGASMNDCNNAANFGTLSWNVPIGPSADFLWCGSPNIRATSTPKAKVIEAYLILSSKSFGSSSEIYMALGEPYAVGTGKGYGVRPSNNRDDAILFYYKDNKLLLANDEDYALDIAGDRPPNEIGNALSIYNCGSTCRGNVGRQNQMEMFGQIASPKGYSSLSFSYNNVGRNAPYYSFNVINGRTEASLQATWVSPKPVCCQAMTKECLACKEGKTIAKFCEDNSGKFGCEIPSNCEHGACCGLGTVWVNGECVADYDSLEDICASPGNEGFDCGIVHANGDNGASCNSRA
jgi:hypothetical protein